MARDNTWLAERLKILHERYFSDVPIKNKVLVRFGRASRTRFGSIIAKPHRGHEQPVTFISINGLFRDEIVPDYVIDATLMHEFVHYTHGFHSPLERQFKHPHKGGIVNREIRTRGAGHILDQQTVWVKKEYKAFLRDNFML